MDENTQPILHESKPACNVYFIGTTPAGKKVGIGPYNSVIHLFEHVYNSRTTFWYGVAEVACTAGELDRAAREAGVSGSISGFMPNPQGVGLKIGFMPSPQGLGLKIELPDGRCGLARYWNGDHREGIAVERRAEIAFICESVLSVKPGRDVTP